MRGCLVVALFAVLVSVASAQCATLFADLATVVSECAAEAPSFNESIGWDFEVFCSDSNLSCKSRLARSLDAIDQNCTQSEITDTLSLYRSAIALHSLTCSHIGDTFCMPLAAQLAGQVTDGDLVPADVEPYCVPCVFRFWQDVVAFSTDPDDIVAISLASSACVKDYRNSNCFIITQQLRNHAEEALTNASESCIEMCASQCMNRINNLYRGFYPAWPFRHYACGVHPTKNNTCLYISGLLFSDCHVFQHCVQNASYNIVKCLDSVECLKKEAQCCAAYIWDMVFVVSPYESISQGLLGSRCVQQNPQIVLTMNITNLNGRVLIWNPKEFTESLLQDVGVLTGMKLNKTSFLSITVVEHGSSEVSVLLTPETPTEVKHIVDDLEVTKTRDQGVLVFVNSKMDPSYRQTMREPVELVLSTLKVRPAGMSSSSSSLASLSHIDVPSGAPATSSRCTLLVALFFFLLSSGSFLTLLI